MVELFDFAVATIFAREVLEAALIIGEFRTIIFRAGNKLSEGEQQRLLRGIRQATIIASILAVIICAAVAIPLAVLSKDFDTKTATIIEGVSKLVASICILQLSLKLPQWLGIYKSRKVHISDASIDTFDLSLNSIRFNVAWNIWREVAECGVFLIPFFLNGEAALAIPLSAVVGSIVGFLVGWGIYYANGRMEKKGSLAVFSAGVLLLLSTGLFTSGCHKFEMVYGSTYVIWKLPEFWGTDRLPMTIFKPFGYSDERTVLQMVCFWGWLIFGLLMHYRKWRITKEVRASIEANSSPAPSTAEEGAESDVAYDVENENVPVDLEVARLEEGQDISISS